MGSVSQIDILGNLFLYPHWSSPTKVGLPKKRKLVHLYNIQSNEVEKGFSCSDPALYRNTRVY